MKKFFKISSVMLAVFMLLSSMTVTSFAASKVKVYPKLSQTKFSYSGANYMPAVTVKTAKGKVLKEGKDYTTSFNPQKNVGKYPIKIKYKGNYTGTKTVYFSICPKPTSVKSLKRSGNSVKVTWKKQTTQTTGYQIKYTKYNTNGKAVSNKTVTVKSDKTTSTKISGISAGNMYSFKVRTYKTVKGKKFYSIWSVSEVLDAKCNNHSYSYGTCKNCGVKSDNYGIDYLKDYVAANGDWKESYYMFADYNSDYDYTLGIFYYPDEDYVSLALLYKDTAYFSVDLSGEDKDLYYCKLTAYDYYIMGTVDAENYTDSSTLECGYSNLTDADTIETYENLAKNMLDLALISADDYFTALTAADLGFTSY